MNPKVPFWNGIGLTLLGLWSYFGTGTSSITALIPTFFGVALLLLAIAVGQARLRQTALYGVLLVALLGLAGSIGGVPDFARVLFGVVVERPVAASAQGAMAVFCFGLTLVAVRVLLEERRALRKRTAPQTRRGLRGSDNA